MLLTENYRETECVEPATKSESVNLGVCIFYCVEYHEYVLDEVIIL